MEKDTGKYILIISAAFIVIAVAGVLILGAVGLGINTAVTVIEPSRRLVLLGNSPVTVSGVNIEKYKRGDKLILIHGLIAESYPGQTRGHFALRIGRGGELPDSVMSSLEELGWIDTFDDTTGNIEASETPTVKAAEKLGFTDCNISADGLVCMGDDGFVYYRSESDKWKLYRSKLDGSQKLKLCDDTAADINVFDGWVYYASRWDSFSIYRIRTDGSDREKLIDGTCRDVRVAQSGIYYSHQLNDGSYHAYRADHDGQNQALLADGYSIASYYDGNILLRSLTELCKIDSATGKLVTLFDGYTHNVSQDADGIWFWAVDRNEFCHLADNGELSVIHTGASFYTYNDGYLYCDGYGGENADYNCNYRLNTETGESEMILALSDQCYDLVSGDAIGFSLRDYRDGKSLPDMPIDILTESPSYVYVVGDMLLTRISHHSNMRQNGKWDCFVICDGKSGTLWD